MTKDHRRVDAGTAQEVLLDDPDFLREIAERVVQQILEAEMTEHIGAAPYERGSSRTAHRNGHKPRALRARVGTLKLLVPQDREGTFSTRLYSRYQRNEKALCLALMEMNVEGVSTRKVKEITEELCRTAFSKSLISSLAGTGSTGLQYIGPAFMIRLCSYSAFYLQIKGKESRRADSNRLPLLIRSVQSGVSEARRRAGALQDPGLDESNRCEEARRAARKLLPLAA